MKDCPECGTHDAMYETASKNERCWKCGYTVTKSTNIRERPNRPEDAGCGQVLERFDGETEELYRQIMNNDSTHCSQNPVGLQKKQDGEYVVVCSRHRN